MTETTIGLDIGTTSVKAVAADGDGNVVARAQVPHRVRVPTPDRFEHDPAVAWRRNVSGALEALGNLGDLGARAVNVSAMVPSLAAVGPGGSGEPLSAGLLYGDERGQAHKTPANDEGELLGFLEWLLAQHPGAAGFWPAQAFANHALGGSAVIDTTTCATTTPVWFGTGWNDDVLTRLGIGAAHLPAVADLGSAAGRLGDSDVVLGAGSIDALGEQIVAGADEPGDVLVILGTTLIVWAVMDEWVEVPGLWTIPSMTSPRMLVGGPSNAGGLFVGWMRDLLGRPVRGRRQVRPDLDPFGLPLWVPYLRGERVPRHERDRRGSLVDLDLTHGPAAVRRAGFEASAFAVRDILERAAAGGTGIQPRRIVATGGGVRVPEWLAALADATNLPVDVVAVPEGGALGSAWIARMAAGLESELSGAARWARIAERVEPDPRWAEASADRFGAWQRLVEAGATGT